MMVKFQVPFESIIEAITDLDSEKKRQILEMIEEQLFETEEDLVEQNPRVLAEIQEARQAYHKGDYQTIQEYVAEQSKKTS